LINLHSRLCINLSLFALFPGKNQSEGFFDAAYEIFRVEFYVGAVPDRAIDGLVVFVDGLQIHITFRYYLEGLIEVKVDLLLN
jgi:hypothetical protein